MEQRSANVIFGKAGGNASKNSYSCKISIPKSWLDKMDITPDHREATLSFDNDRIIVERADGQPMKQVPFESKRKIQRFALIWVEMYKHYATIPFYYFENIEFMGESLSELGFVMDQGESLKNSFPGIDAFRDNDALQRVVDKIDMQTLGNAIFSQWRYWSHWSMAPMKEKDIEWFVIALSRLAELASE